MFQFQSINPGQQQETILHRLPSKVSLTWRRQPFGWALSIKTTTKNEQLKFFGLTERTKMLGIRRSIEEGAGQTMSVRQNSTE